MPAVRVDIERALWAEFSAHIPEHVSNHRYGGHRPRISNYIVFRKLLEVLAFGISYASAADHLVSASTLRRRRDEWIEAGIFKRVEQAALDAYEKVVGLDLENISVDGCLVKAPWGGKEFSGPNPVDRGKPGMKRSLMVDGNGIPLGVILAPANRHDSPLLRPTLECLRRFGFDLPEKITVHLDAGYDSRVTRDLLDELGCDHQISKKGLPLQAGRRWVVERTHAWHNSFGKLLRMTERHLASADAWVCLANAIIVIRRIIGEAWKTHRWARRPRRPVSGK
ncbi:MULTISPECIES: IS5 family transposase [unclassified Leucobacter]|uniref:IS5 family transposase n=1 Tax=unclassified Leucobacter TaxID=2621730 RepID=UPI003018BAD4